MAVKRENSGIDVYHVYSRGTGRQLIFEDDCDRELFLELVNKARGRFHVEIYAYCLMSNHVHLLLHAPLERISAFMKYVCGTYAQRFNSKAGRMGHLFQERFKSEPIEGEEGLMRVVHYIHYNPKKAQIAEVDAYPWSSYGEYVREPRICSTMFVLDLFGGKDGFARIHGSEPPSTFLDVDAPRSRARTMSDDDALAYVQTVLHGTTANEVKTLPRERRDEAIRAIWGAGLSIRRIERLTGVGRGVIDRACKNGIRVKRDS